MFDNVLFGKRIRNYRKNLGLTAYDFAIAADINYALLSQVENGNRMPTTKTTVSILNVLNMSIDDCLGNASLDFKKVYVNLINSSLSLLNNEDLKYLNDVAFSFKERIEVD